MFRPNCRKSRKPKGRNRNIFWPKISAETEPKQYSVNHYSERRKKEDPTPVRDCIIHLVSKVLGRQREAVPKERETGIALIRTCTRALKARFAGLHRAPSSPDTSNGIFGFRGHNPTKLFLVPPPSEVPFRSHHRGGHKPQEPVNVASFAFRVGANSITKCVAIQIYSVIRTRSSPATEMRRKFLPPIRPRFKTLPNAMLHQELSTSLLKVSCLKVKMAICMAASISMDRIVDWLSFD